MNDESLKCHILYLVHKKYLPREKFLCGEHIIRTHQVITVYTKDLKKL